MEQLEEVLIELKDVARELREVNTHMHTHNKSAKLHMALERFEICIIVPVHRVY